MELEQWYARYDIEQAHGHRWSLREVQETLTNRMLASLTGDQSTDAGLLQLGEQLIADEHLRNIPADPALEVLETFLQARPSSMPLRALSDVPAWTTAMNAAVELTAFRRATLHSGTPDSIQPRFRYQRFEARVMALRQLNVPGLTFRNGVLIGDGRAALQAGIRRLRHLIHQLGGGFVIEQIFSRLEQDGRAGRFITRREVAVTPRTVNAAVPWHYLLNLAAQQVQISNLSPPPEQADRLSRTWAHLIELAQTLAAVYDVQFYNGFASLWIADVAPFTREVALYDHLFTVPQWRPADTVRIIRGAFGWVGDGLRETAGFTVAEVITFTNALLRQQLLTPTRIWTFSLTDVHALLPNLDVGVLESLLRACSLPAGRVNQGLDDPDSRPDRALTLASRPLVQDGERYLLMPAPWRATAFFEVVAEAVRTWGQDQHPTINANERMGLALEIFLQETLAAHGVSIVGGVWRALGRHGECDGVVEMQNVRVFVEVKAKMITWPGRTGHDVYLLQDLASSGLKATEQAVRNAVALIEAGTLTLTAPNGAESVLHDDGEATVTLAVSMGDFGGLHVTHVFQRMLAVLAAGGVFKAGRNMDTKELKALNSVNSLAGEYKATSDAFLTLEPSARGEDHGRRLFLSVPQLLVLLDGVRGPAQFINRLLELSASAPLSLDPYLPILTTDGRHPPTLSSVMLAGMARGTPATGLKGPLETLGPRSMRPRPSDAPLPLATSAPTPVD
jgi:hypothetical protein